MLVIDSYYNTTSVVRSSLDGLECRFLYQYLPKMVSGGFFEDTDWPIHDGWSKG